MTQTRYDPQKPDKSAVKAGDSAGTSSRTLASLTQYAFDANVRARGERYYYEQTVRIQKGGRSSVEARVKGSRNYRISLELLDDELIVDCDCPYFDGGELCKHLWAVILASDAHKHMVPPRRGLDLPVLRADEVDGDEFEDYAIDDDDDDDNDDDNDEQEAPAAPVKSNIIQMRDYQKPPVKNPPVPRWQSLMDSMFHSAQSEAREKKGRWPSDIELLYAINVPITMEGRGLVLEVLCRQRKQNGLFGEPKPRKVSRGQVAIMPDPLDRQVVAALTGGNSIDNGYYYGYESPASRYILNEGLQDTVMQLLLRTGRCHLKRGTQGALSPLTAEDGPAWEFALEVSVDEPRRMYVIRGGLRRGDERRDLSEPVMLVAGGWVFWEDRAAPLNDYGAFYWISLLRNEKELRVPVEEGDGLISKICQFERIPRLDLPPELQFERIAGTPLPRLKVSQSTGPFSDGKICGELSFDYAGTVIPCNQPSSSVFSVEQRQLITRDQQSELAAGVRMTQLGFRANRYGLDVKPEIDARKLPALVRTLIAEKWHVEAEGKLYRSEGKFNISVQSGIDWFELHGAIDFDGASATLPALLAALKKGDGIVRLDDGSFGLLPEDWLKKFGLLAGTGALHKDHLRFAAPQACLLDALLSAQPHATCDAAFTRVREELRSFSTIQPVQPPPGFKGQLRPYQGEGLGWLDFLRRFGFGGCLADDMGLGKTIQVLALLESRRVLRGSSAPESGLPSLVVVPRSLIFNWKQESARFTPQLRVLDHTGIGRIKGTQEHFGNYDLVLTTYGTLRSDAAQLKDIRFDYAILDEAQAIKNADTASSKAVRLLQARHRLCMSGTPIENHLGELWSLFEFLNPGMLGAASVFQMGTGGDRVPGEETRGLLARALRPFILRRTKEQVAKDLPQKTEQTLYCELDSAQRKLYDELREHYRQALLSKIQREGVNKSKIQILEALLRLRQAACHPGLIDKARSAESSAKLDALLPQLTEVLEEGHKALVFSQFTSLLSIVRQRLDADKIPYEYLDGKTRDRQAKVEHFQNDPECKLFLISLKAGGLGLNLTAAEYVFLLDPWWNPAVEAQAIDRAHRIGKTRPVFAYRLIARGTVEEKVLQLQETKRALADAIINADNSLIRSLTREDLELLLG